MFRAFLTAGVLLASGLSSVVCAQERIELEAVDSLVVTADVYRGDDTKAWIVLAHQAGSSRGEYREIAPRLIKLGYNAVALDQRSGASFGGVENETAARAAVAGKGDEFTDAIPDIEAGVAWARTQTDRPVFLWGSSYSAALAILLAGRDDDFVDGVVAMSPGEYLRGQSVADAATAIDVPVLIVSPPNERSGWSEIFEAIADPRKEGYTPESGGRHGSSALIPARSPNPEEHWSIVEAFLLRYLPR